MHRNIGVQSEDLDRFQEALGLGMYAIYGYRDRNLDPIYLAPRKPQVFGIDRV